ncbi:unnamed protein product [Ectocarpus sp. 13 AM-2016]
MLSRVANAGARGALRARLPVASAGGRARVPPLIQPAFQSFHAGLPSRESAVDKPAPSRAEDIEANKNAKLFGDNPRLEGIIEAGKLDSAKRLVPFALFLTVPALCREWYVMTEETMLMGCFFLFLGAAMDFGGEGVGKYFDDQTAEIKRAQQSAEEEQIKRVTGDLATEKARLLEMQQMDAISKAIAYGNTRRNEAEAMAAPHTSRESTVKLLEALKGAKIKRVADLRNAEIATALTEVVAKVSADKKLKKAALDNALATLADPSKAAKVDPVSEVFAQYWKQKAIDTEKNKNKPVSLTPEQIAANEADIRSLCEKVGQDPAMLLASMPKTYTADTPTLFS